ncbi:alcohol acetyltransferase [Mycena vulgaris]|nr:alcohol acetyltransferase [Mycena vulgaris]
MKSQMPAPQLLRQLGPLEKYHAVRHFISMDACIVTSARYTTPENTVLTKDTLFPALQLLIETHALLGVRFDSREDSLDLAFFRLQTVNLSRVVEFSGNHDLHDATEKQLSRRFEDTLGDMPLWRLEVLADNTVILAIHHAVGDGLSSAAFHRSLISALNETVLPPCSPSVHVPDLTLLPPIEEVTDIRPSLLKIISVLYSFIAPKSWTSAYSAWTGRPVPTVATIQTHFRLFQLEAEDVKKFSNICRSHKATISSALYELAVCVSSRMIASEPESGRYKTISVNMPVSLRRLVGEQYDDVLCNYVSSYPTFAAVHAEFSWTLAARYAAELQIQKRKSRELLGFIGWVAARYVSFMKGTLGVKRAYGLILSNLGRFEVPANDGKWAVDRVIFSQCDSVAGAALAMNIVGDPAGGLNISITWGEKSLDTPFVEEFISMFLESFHSLLT